MLQYKIKRFNKENEGDRKQRPLTCNLLSIVYRREKMKSYTDCQHQVDNLIQPCNDEKFSNSYLQKYNNPEVFKDGIILKKVSKIQ